MGEKIVGSVFAASMKLLIQHSRASSKYFGEHHSWLSIYKQIWRPLVGEILILEWEEDNNRDKFAVSQSS